MPLGTPLYDPKTHLPVNSSTQYVPAHLQIATTTDPKTNKEVRRFHGAWEGGFSAGYYNTVGSKEGWQPKNFTISRKDRDKERIQQDITDFMDEEDKRDILGERRLVRTDGFEDAGRNAKRRDLTMTRSQHEMSRGHVNLFGDLDVETASLPASTPLSSILESSVPVGERLLRRMGWRGKEAIGNQTATTKRLPYGPAAMPPLHPNDTQGVQIDDEQTQIRVFDTPMPPIPIKSDWHGIGYASNSLSLIDLQAAEDDDPYTKGNVIKMSDALNTGSRMLTMQLPQKRTLPQPEIKKPVPSTSQYDEQISAGTVPVFIPRKRRKTIKSNQESADESAADTPTPTTTMPSKDFIDAPGPLTWNPKELQIEDRLDTHKSLFRSFHLARTPESTAVYYPPPVVPKDFNEIVQLDSQGSGNSNTQRTPHSSLERAQILGEEQIPSKYANIMKHLTPEQRVSVLRAQKKRDHFQDPKTQALQKKLSDAMSERFSVNFSSKDSPKAVKTNPYEEAAKFNMFGQATRETLEWKPSVALTNALGLTKEKVKKDSKEVDDSAPGSRTRKDVSIFSDELFEQPRVAVQQAAAAPVAPPEPDPPLVEDRPPIDLFKAIFEDDDEDEFIASVTGAQPVMMSQTSSEISINKGFEMFDTVAMPAKERTGAPATPGVATTTANPAPFVGVPSLGAGTDEEIAIQPQGGIGGPSLKIKKRSRKTMLRKR